MMLRCTSDVPEYNLAPNASRTARSTSYSAVYPYPPNICMTSVAVATSASLTNNLATAASSETPRVLSSLDAARYVRSRPASRRTFMSAILCDTAWYFPMAFPPASRVRA